MCSVSPWLTQEEAKELVATRSRELLKADPNLCQQTIYPGTIKQVPFGFTEEVAYDCTVTDRLYGIIKNKNLVYITFFKLLIGMPDAKVTERHL